MIQHRIKIEIDGEICGDFTIREDQSYYPQTIMSPSGATVNMHIHGAIYNQSQGYNSLDNDTTRH